VDLAGTLRDWRLNNIVHKTGYAVSGSGHGMLGKTALRRLLVGATRLGESTAAQRVSATA
jgi:hypothetical protein